MEKRRILVIWAECGPETILVQNPTGRRRAWQFPGGRAAGPEALILQAQHRLRIETGLELESTHFRFERSFTRQLERVVQLVHLYRAQIPREVMRKLKGAGPDGHRTQRVPTSSLAGYLNREGLDLLRSAA